ncbi:AIPR family protein [Mycolicibacterium pallens]|uniref:AIPR family protein n=1 Tax=Mycolicibacterium pallens TaxID=370524 RepID=A0ABX8VJ94_9MYCO|nr:AIPR family protein [Mycolicibacterium pallens]QYL17782.1 AIPR family protein [Mycolicibacterium pallens]
MDDYYQELRNRVSVRAETDDDYTSVAFLSEVAEELADAGEIENLTTMHFEGVGQSKRKLLVDGYDLDDPDGSVALAVLVFTGSASLSTLRMTDIKKALTQLESFLKDSLSGDFIRDREESSPAYMLAKSLRERGRSVSRYRLYLITDAKLSDRSKTIEGYDLDGIAVEHHIWDIARLHQVYESKQGREELDIDLCEWIDGGLPALKITQGEDFSTYLAAVPGSLIADLYARYGSRLLESNVRSYLSARGKVNKGIRATVQKEPGRFLAYNNGITATATGVKAAEDLGGKCSIQVIRDLQIVNGGQTTASLFFIRRDDKQADLDPVHVQMKLVVVDPELAAQMVPDISRYANSQNRVSEVDFFSNSPFHVRMEDLSRRTLVPAKSGVNYQTKWFYERTRGQYANERSKLSAADQKKFDAMYPRKQVMTKTDLAKYEISYERKPHIVSAGAQKNFVAFAEAVGSKWEKSPAGFNELYYKEVVAKAIIYNDIRTLVARADWYDKGYLANIVTYTIAKLVHEAERQGGGRHIDLMSVWNAQSTPNAMQDVALQIGRVVLSLLTDGNRPVQNVTEWAKRKECWESVEKVQVNLSGEFLGTLVDPEKRAVAVKEARSVRKVDDSIELQMRLVQIPAAKWLAAEEFGLTRRVLSPKDADLVRLMAKSKVPTERQCLLIADIMRRLGDAGFTFDG